MMMQLHEKSVTVPFLPLSFTASKIINERERERVREREGERERERVRVDDESTTPCHHLCVLF